MKALRPILSLLLLTVAAMPTMATPFIRGDFNDDASFDIADPVSVLDHLFVIGGRPGCADAGDTNDDGELDITDALLSLGHLFLGARPPAAPYPECGVDRTDDRLTCVFRENCSVPNISEIAGHCGGVPVTEYPNSLQPGDDLHRVTLDGPLAVCNDGSPGVFFVRPAPADSPAVDRWVIYLQGGGGCSGFADCLERWCGRQSAAYNESKMSSIYVPNTVGGTGIFRREEIHGIENTFGDFNQVFVYYCSSDSWSGRNSGAVLTDPDDPERQYSLDFRGHDIVRATIARLLGGGMLSDDGVVTMPSIGDAELVLVSGFSAGSGGVSHNGDWIASQLEPQGTTVRLVRDSSFFPRAETHSEPAEGDRIAALLRADYEAAMQYRYGPAMQNSFFDASARDALEGTIDEWRLADKSYISHNHITTPSFVRIDLLDRPTRQRFADMGVSTEDFAAMMATTLLGVPNIATHGAEASAIAQPGGVFGPMCGDHVGIMNDNSFFARSVEGNLGVPRTYHDTLVHWLGGTVVTLVDSPSDSSTVCGAPQVEDE